MITSIAFIVYPVSNMERARAFYEHVLGLHVSYDYRDVWVEYDLGGSTFAITMMEMCHAPGAKGAGGRTGTLGPLRRDILLQR